MRTPAADGSLPASTAPERITLSATIAVPGRESSREGEVLGSEAVRVEEDQVERAARSGSTSAARPTRTSTRSASPARSRFARAAAAHSGSASTVTRSVLGQRPREPDRAVARERPELEDRARALHPREQVQQLAPVGRHGGRLRGGLERGVRGDGPLLEPAVHLVPELHGPTLSDRLASSPMVIAIDGPAGAGKSSVARAVAGGSASPTSTRGRCTAVALAAACGRSGVRRDRLVLCDRVLLDGEDVTEAIRAPEVSEAASRVAADPAVRAAIVAKQQAWLADGDWVAEGRDIGTVVAPDAEVKVFLTADPHERARRRAEELGADVEAVLATSASATRATPPREPRRSRRRPTRSRSTRPA